MRKIKNLNKPTYLKKLQNLPLNPSEKRMVEELMQEPIAYVPQVQFRRTMLMNKVMTINIPVPPGKTLTQNEEQTLFTQMNYMKHLLCLNRRRLLRMGRWDVPAVQDMIRNHFKMLDLRSRIINGNMGLVLAMAKRTHMENVEFTDLVSEGSMALLRAAEKFDCQRGLKFSTYACQAILKGFSRAAKDYYRHRNLFPVQWDTGFEKDDSLEQQRGRSLREMVDEIGVVFKNNLAELSEMEYHVVDLRFSLSDKQRPPLTLKEVGTKLGLTKERIRQIQNKALAKLRQATEERIPQV